MSNNPDQQQSPAKEIESTINGLAQSVFVAEQAYLIQGVPLTFQSQINGGNFGELFGTLRSCLLDRYLLNITKIFERENQAYSCFSIATVLSLLERNKDHLCITQRPYFFRVLSDCSGLSSRSLMHLSDTEVTAYVAQLFRRSLPDVSRSDDCALSRALKAARFVRDKRIAHGEKFAAEDLPVAVHGELAGLLDYAKKFIGVIGWGYLSTGYVVNGQYLLSSDATSGAEAMRRLLEELPVISN